MEKQHYDKFTDHSVKEDDASRRQHGVNQDDDTELRKSVKTHLSFLESDAPTNEPGTPSQSFKYKAKFTVKNARTLDIQTFTEDKLTSHDQIPNYILQMLMMANYHVREFTLKGINPMDALLGIFHGSDNFLRQYIAVKLSECQLSVPFILPDPGDPGVKQTILLSALGKITKSWRGASINDSAKEVYATEHPFPIVSFIRLGNVTMSKSSLMNKIISDGNVDHEFFFHKNMEGGDFVRGVVDGLVELVWYLPGGCGKNTLKNEICFANLRGDAQNFKKQVNILCEISNILCILLPSEMPDKRVGNFLEKAMSSKSKIILIFNENTREEVKKYYDSVIDQHSTKLYSITKSLMASDYRFLKCIRQAIQSNIKETEVKSLEKWFKLQLHIPVLADLERKKHNPKFRPNNENTRGENDVNEPYEDIRKEKKAQMESFQKMDTEIRLLLNSIAVMDEGMLNRNLQRLKYLFDRASLSAMAKLHQQYRLKLQETQNDMLDSQSHEENRLKDVEALISYSIFSLEHIVRELAQLHQLSDFVMNNYASVGAKILLSGHPLELLDGDSGYLPLTWFDAVYKEVERETNNARICVISVLGIQNSGKSAMLNAMFGLEFPLSGRKCTRGAFVCLVPLSDRLKSESNFDFLLIIDTEGLRRWVEPTVGEHSIELATFVIGVADVTIVNIFGEKHNEIIEFLNMVVRAFLKMKLLKEKKNCKILYHNVYATNTDESFTANWQNLKHDLDNMAKLVAVQENCEDQYQKLDDIIAFDENKDMFYIPNLLKGSPPMAPVNPNYGIAVQKVKESIIELMCSEKLIKLTVSSFC
ncbi:interferon-induced very large GTPase 1-like [Xenia sp. Carnegie-2017]|uniref:interferon-induced very large GTPase 1-like n=1 Tax=Xenia sp. Carnegie-2017 TaxID=2897299 RepID=UPI001F033A7D|nr:interferon-induced very large GTPase 1-like [Xenia sp. Carnegie-2017]